jgi:hypothetical protein
VQQHLHVVYPNLARSCLVDKLPRSACQVVDNLQKWSVTSSCPIRAVKNGVSPRAAPSEQSKMECHLELPHQRSPEPLSKSNGWHERKGGKRGKVAHAPETTRPLDIKSKTVFHRLGNRSRITIICCPDDENWEQKLDYVHLAHTRRKWP